MSNLNEIQNIDEQIALLQSRKNEILDGQRKDALKQAKALINTFGFTSSELGLAASSKVTTAANIDKLVKKRSPKYANPENPTETWSGGGKPKWVQAYLDKGGKLEELLINK